MILVVNSFFEHHKMLEKQFKINQDKVIDEKQELQLALSLANETLPVAAPEVKLGPNILLDAKNWTELLESFYSAGAIET